MHAQASDASFFLALWFRVLFGSAHLLVSLSFCAFLTVRLTYLFDPEEPVYTGCIPQLLS